MAVTEKINSDGPGRYATDGRIESRRPRGRLMFTMAMKSISVFDCFIRYLALFFVGSSIILIFKFKP